MGIINLGGPVNASIETTRIDALLETEDNLVRVCFALGEEVWLAGLL
ncbi:hypothetical protein [Mangrovibacter yixingensis]|nr:hypothetical protein [Mangrovibacter yixingensis]